MKLNDLTCLSYLRQGGRLTVLLPTTAEATTETAEAVAGTLAAADRLTVTTDNEPPARTVETLTGYGYVEQATVADGLMTVVLTQTAPTADTARARKLAQIEAYDRTTEQFTLNGDTLWLPYEMRSRLRDRFDVEEADGKTETTLWAGDKAYTLPISEARTMLAAVEAYAIKTYDMNAWHKSCVLALETEEEIEQYDHTTGYPDKLAF